MSIELLKIEQKGPMSFTCVKGIPFIDVTSPLFFNHVLCIVIVTIHMLDIQLLHT
jgi:hypothetical protein